MVQGEGMTENCTQLKGHSLLTLDDWGENPGTAIVIKIWIDVVKFWFKLWAC